MLEVNTGLISWTIVTFVLLLIVLRKFAWKPLLEGLQRREERVRTSIERAEQAQKDAERLMEENRQRLAQADQESHRLLSEGRVLAEKLKADIVEQANKQSRKMIEQAHQEIEREKEAALAQLRDEVATLAIKAAEKILDETLDEKRQRKLLDTYLDSIKGN
ncbi:MAG TPA: F0F1 ATP synthase subunit B [Bacteroidota bacterium]|jgi:F-type H+-transporting ATPase subunit b